MLQIGRGRVAKVAFAWHYFWI